MITLEAVTVTDYPVQGVSLMMFATSAVFFWLFLVHQVWWRWSCTIFLCRQNVLPYAHQQCWSIESTIYIFH